MTEPIALFCTAGGANVTVQSFSDIHPTETGFHAECGGCSWAMSSRQATRGAGGIIGHPTEPLGALKYESNKHALGCAEVPHELWPGERR